MGTAIRRPPAIRAEQYNPDRFLHPQLTREKKDKVLITEKNSEIQEEIILRERSTLEETRNTRVSPLHRREVPNQSTSTLPLDNYVTPNISDKQIKLHHELLLLFNQFLSNKNRALQVPKRLSHIERNFLPFISHLATIRKWTTGASAATTAGALWGALKASGIPKTPPISTALHRLDAMAAMEDIAFPILIEPQRIMTLADSLISNADTRTTGLIIFIAARNALRVCDVIKISEVTKLAEDIITLKLIKGKTSSTIPKVIHCDPRPYEQHLLALPKMDKKDKKAVTKALRTLEPDASLRSLRSSTTLAMSLNGTPRDTIQLFTHHKTEATLNRYLRWGAVDANMAQTMVTAQRDLFNLPQETFSATVSLTSYFLIQNIKSRALAQQRNEGKKRFTMTDGSSGESEDEEE